MFQSFCDTERSYSLRGSRFDTPLRALPVSMCLYEGCRGRPCPATGSGRQGPQLPRQLAQSREQLCDHKDLVLRHLSQLGLRVNWEKSKLSPVQRISFRGVELDSVSMTACLTDERAQAVLNCLSSFRGRNVVPLKQFQRLLGHMAFAAAVTPLGLLHMRPLQHWLHSRVPRWAWRRGTLRVNITQQCRRSLSPWTGLAFLRAGVPLEQVSRHTVVTTDVSSMGWGATCNRQAASGLWMGPRLLWHINYLELWAVHLILQQFPARQARASLHGQQCGCLVHQPVGRYTITPHVTARPPSPPLESHAVQVTARCPHPGEAQSCGRRALTTSHVPRRMVSRTPLPCDSPSLAHSSEEGSPLSGARHHMAPASRSVEPPCVATGRDVADLSGLPLAVVETITQARAPSTRQIYALKWSLFANWCSRREDPRICTIGEVLSFLQDRLERRLSPSTLKVYVAAIAAHQDAVDGQSLGKHDLIVRFLKGTRRMNPSRSPLVPSWDLSIVLAGLSRTEIPVG